MQTTPTGTHEDLSTEERAAAISLCDRLIGICRDGELGFHTAADDVRSPACKNLFLAYAWQRAQFAGELTAMVRRLGGQPTQGGSVTGLLCRDLVDLRATGSERSLSTVVAECERGEVTALRAYEECARRAPHGAVATVVTRQYAAIKTAHDNVRSLRDMRQSG
jgi:uncharacterized protein (TIGR02284 family)